MTNPLDPNRILYSLIWFGNNQLLSSFWHYDSMCFRTHNHDILQSYSLSLWRHVWDGAAGGANHISGGCVPPSWAAAGADWSTAIISLIDYTCVLWRSAGKRPECSLTPEHIITHLGEICQLFILYAASSFCYIKHQMYINNAYFHPSVK